MRRTTSGLLVGALLGAAGGAVMTVRSSMAQFTGGGGTTEVAGTVDIGTMPRQFEVTGLEGARVAVEGPVSVTNAIEVSGYSSVPTVALENGTIVNFTPETLAALTGESRVCTDYPVGNNTLSGTVFTFPAVAGQQTAALKFHDFGVTVDYVACWRASQADGGPTPSCTPDAGVANIPLHSGDSWLVDGLADHHRLRCLTCTHAGPPSGGTALVGGSISICTPSP